MAKFKAGDKVKFLGDTYIVDGDNGKGMVTLIDIESGDSLQPVE